MNIWELEQAADWLNFRNRLIAKQLTPSQQKILIDLSAVPSGATHALIHRRQINEVLKSNIKIQTSKLAENNFAVGTQRRDSPWCNIARITFYDKDGTELKGYDRVIYIELGEETLDFTQPNQIDNWFHAELKRHTPKSA